MSPSSPQDYEFPAPWGIGIAHATSAWKRDITDRNGRTVIFSLDEKLALRIVKAVNAVEAPAITKEAGIWRFGYLFGK